MHERRISKYKHALTFVLGDPSRAHAQALPLLRIWFRDVGAFAPSHYPAHCFSDQQPEFTATAYTTEPET
jgi:hypothetical protein